VRKSSEEGSAVARSTSGCGDGEACFFLLKVFEANEGIDGIAGTSSLSIEGRRLVPALCPPSDFFLERKRFIVSVVSDALVDYSPADAADRHWHSGSRSNCVIAADRRRRD